MNIGERVGDYEIVEILGSGGMGQVYKVRNTLSERMEAMKILLPNLESDAGLADRFLREIKVQAALDHPNIAKLHTAMRAGNQLLMFMEFVDGVAVSKQIEQGPLPSAGAASIAAQVLDALAYAHAHGVVHRDIKPANIMLTSSGVVKLMDFGIARVQADTRLTQTGGAVGSLFYMSPEQIRGAEPDPRSDIYSLGVTLYEMVTGRRPFAGDSDYEIMSAHLQQTPLSPGEVVSGIPSDMSEIILTAIAKDPAARFQSAVAFRSALSSVFPALSGAPTGIRTGAVPPPLPMPVSPPPVFAAPPPPPPIPTAPPRPPASSAVSSAPPMPPPVSIPPPPVPAAMSMAAAAPKSNRGLYMALGSIATLLVLIAAVIEGPKLMHGGSSSAAEPAASSVSQPPPAAPASPGANDAATAAPAAAADSIAPPATPSASATAVSTPSAASPGWTPVGKTPSAAPASAAAPAPSQVNASPAPQNFQAQQAPIQQTPPQAYPAAQQPAPAPAPAVNREYAQLRQQFNELSIRANSASAGLQRFQQQQAGQGLGLRADIREAKTRLDYQLQEAMSQMSGGDYEGATQSMRYAQNAMETIEKFLGR